MDLVLNKSTIEEIEVTYEEKKYQMFVVEIHVNCFFGKSSAFQTKEEVVWAYAEYLYQHLESRKREGVEYLDMSKEHIYSETMAHIYGWIYLKLPSTEVIHLNANEDRWYVRLAMWFYEH